MILTCKSQSGTTRIHTHLQEVIRRNKVTIKNNVYSREHNHRYNSRGVDLKYK